MHEAILRGNHITIGWVPSHGNERTNQAAREAAMRLEEFIPVPYLDWFPLIKERTCYLWDESWRTEGRELRTLKVSPGKLKSASMKLNRSDSASMVQNTSNRVLLREHNTKDLLSDGRKIHMVL